MLQNPPMACFELHPEVAPVDPAEATVSGWVHPDYVSVAAQFRNNFDGVELGASACVVVDGYRVLDLWGGQVALGGDPWREQTVVPFYSCSKILTTLVCHQLIDSLSYDLDAPLIDVWPELKAAQQGATLKMALNHSLGLPAMSEPLKPGAYEDHAYMAEQLAAQSPWWPPGSAVGYHPVTFGFVLNEWVLRVSGETIGQRFARLWAKPYALECWIGLPPSEFPKVAPLVPMRYREGESRGPIMDTAKQQGTIQNAWMFNAGGWRIDRVNCAEGLAPEIPAAGGVGNARGLASTLALLLQPEVRAQLGFSEQALERLVSLDVHTELDQTLLRPTAFSLGMMKNMPARSEDPDDCFRIPSRAFGHVGQGGSFALCDPDRNLTMAYTMNQLGPGMLLNPRGQRLIDALYSNL